MYTKVLGKNCTNLVSLNVAEERRKKLITDKVGFFNICGQ
jgi:hypothetical protein